MATDRIATPPKGVVVRPVPDWFFDDLYTVSGFVDILTSLGVAGFSHFGLFNNAPDGSVLKVVGVTGANDGGGGKPCFALNGTLGSHISDGASISLGGTPGPGQLFGLANAAPQLAGPIGLIGVSGFDSATVFSHFPMFIIPPGWSLVFGENEKTDTSAIGIWYQRSSR